MKYFALFLFICIAPAMQAQVDAPPAYPRDGAIRLLENEHVIVWNISWLKQDYPVHRHRYDHTGVYYSPGDRIITSTEGEAREVHTDAWGISFQLAGVTHTESGVSDEPLRAVFIQIKRPVAEAIEHNGSIPAFPNDGPLERLANARVKVWEYTEGFPGTANSSSTTDPAMPANTGNLDTSGHSHDHDAVVVWFDADNQPNTQFVSRGSIHHKDIPTAAIRVFVFEIL